MWFPATIYADDQSADKLFCNTYVCVLFVYTAIYAHRAIEKEKLQVEANCPRAQLAL